jgi:hypothetical protein
MLLRSRPCCRLAVLTGAVLLSAAGLTAGAPAQAAPVPAVPACVDFLPLADNAVLGTNFVRGGYDFHALAGGVPFVNVFTDVQGTAVHGAQFGNAGIRILPPAPADTVDVTMGVFNTPMVTIRAFDAAGALVDTAFVPADNIVHTVTLDGAQDITRMRLTGGGQEAVINEICSS